MKIVHVMTWYIPNMGYQENYLPAEEKKLGHDVEIITSDRIPVYDGFDQFIGKFFTNRVIGSGIFKEKGVKIHRLPCFEFKTEILLKGLKKKLRELKPEIVHAHGPYLLLTLQVILYSKKLNYKVVVDDHTHERWLNINSFFGRFNITIYKIFYLIYGKRISYFLPVAYSVKQILQKILKIPDEKIEFLYLGVNSNCFKKSDELRKNGRKEIGINDGNFLIVSAGKFEEIKNIHILIKIFNKISKKHPNVRLLLVGNGPIDYMKKLTNLVKRLGITKKIIFVDFVPNSELSKYYNAADIGVWPGTPTITVIEALGTGLPVIIRDDLAYKHLFENNAALKFKTGSNVSLSNKLLKLIENEKLRTTIAHNSLNLVTETLSWKKIAEKSISIYSSQRSKNDFKN